MSIDSVSMNKALNNEAYAAQVIRSGKCSASERSQLAAKWGNAKITQWESVDSTKYEITDDVKANARATGDKKVDEATGGFDGKSDGTKSAVGAGMAITSGAAGAGAAAIALNVLGLSKTGAHARFSAFVAAGVGAVLVALSKALHSMDPNSEQAQACDDLAPVMSDSQNELQEQQDVLSETTNEVVESTDDMTKISEEANKETEAAQKNYEKLQARYQELAAKQEAAKAGGEPLTESEKAEFQQLSGVLGTVFEDLQNIKAEGDESLDEAKEAVEEKQEVYDDAAAKMEEVQEITEYQAEFDEATVDNAKLVKTASYAGVVGSAGVLVGGLKGLAQWGNWAAMAAGAVAVGEAAISASTFSNIIKEQGDYQQRAETGVENRQATENVNLETSDLYEEELDNYAGSIDLMDEIEFTETTATETPIVALTDTPAENDENGTSSPLTDGTGSSAEANPFAPPSNDEGAGKTGDTGDDKSNPFAKPDKEDEK